jgi:acetyltransferase EpsM
MVLNEKGFYTPAVKGTRKGRGTRIVIFGAGNLASNIIDILRQKYFEILGFISTEKPGTIANTLPVLGDIEYYKNNQALQKEYFHIAIGENSVRYNILEMIKNNEDKLLSIISNQCLISDNCDICNGTYISHGAILQHDVSVGKCCIIDTGVILEHHVQIGEYVNISPSATLCGGVKVGNGAIIGAGATVIEKIVIGENSLIGAGSVVIQDIEPNVIAVGNPARIIKRRDFLDIYIK